MRWLTYLGFLLIVGGPVAVNWFSPEGAHSDSVNDWQRDVDRRLIDLRTTVYEHKRWTQTVFSLLCVGLGLLLILASVKIASLELRLEALRNQIANLGNARTESPGAPTGGQP